MGAAQLVLLLMTGSCLATSVFYVDNGRDQTVSYPLQKKRVAQFESEILHVLGIEQPPKKNQKRATDEALVDYMHALYSQLDAKKGEWEDADTVLSFSPFESQLEEGGLRSLCFRVSNFPLEGQLVGAQLRLRIPREVAGVDVFNKREDGLERLSSVTLFGQGNASVNISREVSSWMSGANHSGCLFVVLHDAQGAALPPDDLHAFGVASFVNDNSKKRSKREASISPPSSPSSSRPTDPLRVNRDTRSAQHECRRHGLYVNFADLGWKQWVIAPEGYQAHYCAGACSFPLTERANATNHAIVQTLVHLVDPKRASAAHCAPAQLAPMKILFVDNEDNVVMKKYRDMHVRSCGCQ